MSLYLMYFSFTGSEFDEDEVGSEDEDSDDSWTTQEEFTSDLILRSGSVLTIDQINFKK